MHLTTAPHVIEYRGSFTLPASPARVWWALGRFERYEQWWGWLEELRVDGGGLQPGCVLRGTVVPPLPYRMQVHITLLECTPPRVVRASIEGDLRGEAGLLLAPVPRGTRAQVHWTVEMMQTPMRFAARVARPVLLWGHDRVVDATVTTFCRQLHTVLRD